MTSTYLLRANDIPSTNEKEIKRLYRKTDAETIGYLSSKYIRDAIKRYLRKGFSLGQRWDSDEAFLHEVKTLYKNKLRRIQSESDQDVCYIERAPAPTPLRYRPTEARRRGYFLGKSRAVQRQLQRALTASFRRKTPS